ncbi:pheromone A receptor-domain-containing protein [Cercophora scortea]|uniref:Pheromone A receptor-domain-containing protein n=1 Tax=Cercophora scortea TaxID=314031 RepID=A0AAE0MI25_9PEZI|nr:pheromone A receptor-domain-containing protein [Cercophora scortea]
MGVYFTTTPQERIGPGPPYTYPSLQVNLFFRVFLGLLSILVPVVPGRVLWWNGEFAATTFCVITSIINLYYVTNALLWRDDNVATWYAGYGWCDLQVYTSFPLETAYAICLFEIMRGLARKVSLERVSDFTPHERRRQHIHSALIIFSIPLVQLVLMFFVKIRRYNISTLAGCTALYDTDWIVLTVYIVPTLIFTVAGTTMAVLAFRRYRQIERLTREIVSSNDSAHSARQQRVRRKLYFMALVIIIVVMPIYCVMFVMNILAGAPWSTPYDFDRIHNSPEPFSMHTITFTTSDLMTFPDLAVNYIAVLTSAAIFVTFGMSTEAFNQYRKFLLLLGLGKIWPGLHNEYHPSSGSNSGQSWWGSMVRSRDTRTETTQSSGDRKNSILPTTEHISLGTQSRKSSHTGSEAYLFSASTASGSRHNTADPSAEHNNPWPDLPEKDNLPAAPKAARPRHTMNPYVFNMTPSEPLRVPLPRFSLPSLRRDKDRTTATGKQHDTTPPPPPPPSSQPDTRRPDHISEEEAEHDVDVLRWGTSNPVGPRFDTHV